MELLVKRQIKTELSTVGELFVNGIHECFTLEPKDRGLTSAMTPEVIADTKIDGKTAIPTGRYAVVKYFSPDHHCEVPLLQGIDGFGFVEIHKGNFPKDTKGCLLLGQARTKDAVINSAVAIDHFYPKVFGAIAAGEEVWITYQ